MNELNPKQLKFIEHYLRTGNGAESARVAGYAHANAPQAASGLLKNPAVKEALEKHRKSSQATAVYNLQFAVVEADMCIEFSRSTNNANAMVKAVELKTKLHGLLIEKFEHRLQQGFILNICGIDGPDETVEVFEEPTLISEKNKPGDDANEKEK